MDFSDIKYDIFSYMSGQLDSQDHDLFSIPIDDMSSEEWNLFSSKWTYPQYLFNELDIDSVDMMRWWREDANCAEYITRTEYVSGTIVQFVLLDELQQILEDYKFRNVYR